MKSPPRTPLPDLERRQGEPLYRQIYRRFRDAIEQGLLAPGDRVASARSLASELGVRAAGGLQPAHGRGLLPGQGPGRHRGVAAPAGRGADAPPAGAGRASARRGGHAWL